VTAKPNGKAEVPAAEDNPKAPAWWEAPLDREPPVTAGRGLCKRYKPRSVRLPSRAGDAQGATSTLRTVPPRGNVKNDEEAVQRAGYEIDAIADRRASFAAAGRTHPEADGGS